MNVGYLLPIGARIWCHYRESKREPSVTSRMLINKPWYGRVFYDFLSQGDATVCSPRANLWLVLWCAGSCPSAKTGTRRTVKNECLCGGEARHPFPTLALSFGNLLGTSPWKGQPFLRCDLILHAVVGGAPGGRLTQAQPGTWSWETELGSNRPCWALDPGGHVKWDLWPCWLHAVVEREGAEERG